MASQFDLKTLCVYSAVALSVFIPTCAARGGVLGSPFRLLAERKVGRSHRRHTQGLAFPKPHLAGADGSAHVLAFDLHHVSSGLGVKFLSKGYQARRIQGSLLRYSASPVSFPPASGWSYYEYYVVISLGTPPVQFALLFDTGSDLLWVQCRCQQNGGCILDLGLTQSTGTPLTSYNPAASSTSKLMCLNAPGSNQCSAIPHNSKCKNATCPFSIQYGTGAVSGEYLADIAQLPLAGNKTLQNNIAFGCGESIDSRTRALLSLDGILGMQFFPNSRSLFYQFYSSGLLAGVIAFCFDGFDETGSKVRLGAGKTPPNMQTTQLIYTSGYSPFVNVTSITVGNRTVAGTKNIGNFCTGSKCTNYGAVLVDTGTSITAMPSAMYNSLKSLIGGSNVFMSQFNGLDCTSGGVSSLPNISIHFPTSTWSIPPTTYMFPIGARRQCLGVLAWTGLQFNLQIGESWIQNNFIQMDFTKKIFGFAPQNCAKSTLFQ